MSFISETLLRRSLQRALQSQPKGFKADAILDLVAKGSSSAAVHFGTDSLGPRGAGSSFGMMTAEDDGMVLRKVAAHTESATVTVAQTGSSSLVQCGTCGELRFKTDILAAGTQAACGLPQCPFGGSTTAMRRDDVSLKAVREAMRSTAEQRLARIPAGAAAAMRITAARALQ